MGTVTLPRQGRRGRLIAFLIALVLLAEIDIGGSCGCDKFAPRVTSMSQIW